MASELEILDSFLGSHLWMSSPCLFSLTLMNEWVEGLVCQQFPGRSSAHQMLVTTDNDGNRRYKLQPRSRGRRRKSLHGLANMHKGHLWNGFHTLGLGQRLWYQLSFYLLGDKGKEHRPCPGGSLILWVFPSHQPSVLTA